jgi:sialate O-acetylesterase
MKKKRKDFILFSLLFFSALVIGDIGLPAIISDGMVLQQQVDAPLWGWAEPGSIITVKADWESNYVNATTTKDGKWSTRVKTPPAGGPYSLIISNDSSTFKINNILIGEVWLCSGQSNMDWPVKRSENGLEISQKTHNSKIRLFTIAKQKAESPMEIGRC